MRVLYCGECGHEAIILVHGRCARCVADDTHPAPIWGIQEEIADIVGGTPGTWADKIRDIYNENTHLRALLDAHGVRHHVCLTCKHWSWTDIGDFRRACLHPDNARLYPLDKDPLDWCDEWESTKGNYMTKQIEALHGRVAELELRSMKEEEEEIDDNNDDNDDMMESREKPEENEIDKALEIMDSMGMRRTPVSIRQEDYDYLMSAECDARLREIFKYDLEVIKSVIENLKGGQIYPAYGGPVEDVEDEEHEEDEEDESP